MTGKELRELRVKLGLKQVQCAYMAKVALRTWQAWETGTRTMCAGLIELWLIKAGVHGEYTYNVPIDPAAVTYNVPIDEPIDLEATLEIAMRGEI